MQSSDVGENEIGTRKEEKTIEGGQIRKDEKKKCAKFLRHFGLCVNGSVTSKRIQGKFELII